jgi:hypothetical protein
LIREADSIRDGRGQSLTLAADKSGIMPVIRQEYGQHPQKRKESAYFVDQKDAGVVGNKP